MHEDDRVFNGRRLAVCFEALEGRGRSVGSVCLRLLG